MSQQDCVSQLEICGHVETASSSVQVAVSSLHTRGHSTFLQGSQTDWENDDMDRDQSPVSKSFISQDGTPNLQLRPYQHEMLEKSIQKNIIVAVWGRRFQSMIKR